MFKETYCLTSLLYISENGTIEIHEFEALFNEFPIKPDGKNLIALFNEVDDDHNGYITKE